LIAAEEYRHRQQRAREAAAGRGLRALAAFSRGGGTHDRIADVLWLTGLSTSQPFVGDLPGHWRAAGHVAVVVEVDGPVTAFVDAEELQTPPVADEVIVTDDPVSAVADAVSARVGVLGCDVVTPAWWAVLERGAELVPADDLGVALRRVKSPAEQELLRSAGRLGSSAMVAALAAAEPGASEAEVAAPFVDHVVRGGGAMYDVAVSSGPVSGTLGPSGGAAGQPRGRRGGWRRAICCASTATARSAATCSTSREARSSATRRPTSRRS
jgi:Xaa-Pro aminopeptidase